MLFFPIEVIILLALVLYELARILIWQVLNLQIREMAFVFEINSKSVRQYLANIAKNHQEKDFKFEWSEEGFNCRDDNIKFEWSEEGVP